jgi:antitoxin (DNA-binding transcriptional repressor) of toxin-antitoxin stability system
MASLAEHLVNVHQAKTQLFRLLQEVEQGQEVVIARAGVPIARPCAMRGQIELAEDFDAPLADLFEVLQ